MLVDELRVELPAEAVDSAARARDARDDRLEREYALRVAGIPAERAAAIAVAISEARRDTPPPQSSAC
jgi:hypothetical protein